MTGRSLPLSGIRIVAVEQLMALPFGTQLLADLGADVIAVEPVGYAESEIVPWRLRTGRRKRRISVQLDDPRGQQIVRELAATADVFAENYRPGVMARYGLGYDDLRAVKPDIIYLSVSGYGGFDVLPSPHSELAAYGPIGEAMGGVMHSLLSSGLTGFFPGALGDIVSSLYGVVGVLVALHDRSLTGDGDRVDISMADSLLTIAEMPVISHALTVDGFRASKKDGVEKRKGIVIGGQFPASDGVFVLIVLNDRHFAALARMLGQPEWIELDRVAETPEERYVLAESVIAPAIAEWAATKTKAAAAAELRAAGLAAAPVLGPEDILVEPHFAARRMIERVETGETSVRVVGNPIKLGRVEQHRDLTDQARIAEPGSDSAAILTSVLGRDADDVCDLLNAGIVQG